MKWSALSGSSLNSIRNKIKPDLIWSHKQIWNESSNNTRTLLPLLFPINIPLLYLLLSRKRICCVDSTVEKNKTSQTNLNENVLCLNFRCLSHTFVFSCYLSLSHSLFRTKKCSLRNCSRIALRRIAVKSQPRRFLYQYQWPSAKEIWSNRKKLKNSVGLVRKVLKNCKRTFRPCYCFLFFHSSSFEKHKLNVLKVNNNKKVWCGLKKNPNSNLFFRLFAWDPIPYLKRVVC